MSGSVKSKDESAKKMKRNNEEKAMNRFESSRKSETNHQQIGKPSESPLGELDEESVYDFYFNNLLPAIKASLPLLVHRIRSDFWIYLKIGGDRAKKWLTPNWEAPSSLLQKLEQAASNSTVHEFMLRHFDTNGDGTISANELINMTDILAKLPSRHPETWFQWFSQAWPMMDWKLGVLLWRTFGGILMAVVLVSLLPGRLHGFLGKLLRWPVLALTNSMIAVELSVYIVIRLFIRIVETVFANPKHRRLRRLMRQSKSYGEWYQYATELDQSQGRDKWRDVIHDETSYRYNWSFIKELIRDMRKSRRQGDTLMALAVLQQCTRKNVGGIMSEESFSFTNTGEPKHIVQEFVEEVAITLRWVTSHVTTQGIEIDVDLLSVKEFDEKLSTKVTQEKNKIWSSLMIWASRKDEPPSRRPSDDWQSDGSENDGVRLPEKAAQPTASPPGKESRKDTSGAPPDESHPSQDRDMKLMSLQKEKMIAFLKRARAAYGRTALCLSGGAMMGVYHFGVVKALLEMKCLPNIISGTSAGSVVGAIVCTRTDDEIRRDLDPRILSQKLTCFDAPWSERIKRVYEKGCMFDYKHWRELIKWFTCGDMTFEEAFIKTGRVFCITLSATTKKAPPVLINHVSAPNVVIASAVIASAAVPGFVEPVRLEVKGPDGKVYYQGDKDQTYWDGSIEQDIPTAGLAEMLNCQFFVAAQCNPHIVPFFYNPRGGVGRPSRWSNRGREDSWRGGFLLSALELYLKSDMKAKFQFLNDIEAAVGFTSTMMTQRFEGSTTIVPQVSFMDYFKLFSDPTCEDIIRQEHGGTIAAYEHCAMIRLHYRVADALDECLRRLEASDAGARKLGRESILQASQTHRSALVTPTGRLPGMANDIICASTESSSTDAEGDDEMGQNEFDEIESLVRNKTLI